MSRRGRWKANAGRVGEMANAGDLKSPDLYGLAGSSPAPGILIETKTNTGR